MYASFVRKIEFGRNRVKIGLIGKAWNLYPASIPASGWREERLGLASYSSTVPDNRKPVQPVWWFLGVCLSNSAHEPRTVEMVCPGPGVVGGKRFTAQRLITRGIFQLNGWNTSLLFPCTLVPICCDPRNGAETRVCWSKNNPPRPKAALTAG